MVVLGLLVLLGLPIQVFAGTYVDNVLTSAESADIDGASGNTTYTKAFSIKNADYFAVGYKASSVTGSVDVKIELQESYDLPTTEGAADTTYVEPESFSDIETNLITETWHYKAISPVAMPYARFKVTGNPGSNNDTIVNIKIGKQE